MNTKTLSFWGVGGGTMAAMDDSDIVLGQAYVFRWPDARLAPGYDVQDTGAFRLMTGVAVKQRGESRWVALRTKTQTFIVPPDDVLRPA